MMSELPEQGKAEKKAGVNWRVMTPLIIFLGVGALFFYALVTSEPGGDKLPSPLLGKEIPDFTLPAVPGLKTAGGQEAMPGFDARTLKKSGKLTIVNVWASWCTSCRYEHRFLEELARKTGGQLYGLNYKDAPGKARAFLARFGNPYKAVGMDRSGRIGIDWGVYGVPETFIINRQGKIIFKYPGPVNTKIIDTVILPALHNRGIKTSVPVS